VALTAHVVIAPTSTFLNDGCRYIPYPFFVAAGQRPLVAGLAELKRLGELEYGWKVEPIVFAVSIPNTLASIQKLSRIKDGKSTNYLCDHPLVPGHVICFVLTP